MRVLAYLFIAMLSLPVVAVPPAQAQGLQVSAKDTGGKFFGPQVVMVIVDVAAARDSDTGPLSLQVNGANVPLVHLVDSRWFAFMADRDLFTSLAQAAGLPGEQISAQGRNFWKLGASGKLLLFPALPGAVGHDLANNRVNPNLDLNADCAAPVTDQDACVEWPYIALFNFNDGDTVSIRHSDQSSTLKYVKPSLEDVSVSLDRQAYPLGAEIMLRLTDYMWNINPVEEDRIHFAFSGTTAGVFYQASPALAPAKLDLLSLGFDEKQALQVDGLAGIKFTKTINGISETVLRENMPNSAFFENLNLENAADMLANKEETQVRFDYFGRSTSAGMSTSDASVSIEKEKPKYGEIPEIKIPAPDPYSIGEPLLADPAGNKVDRIMAGTTVLVQTRITNNISTEQPFTYILLVKDDNGFTSMLTWIEGAINPSASKEYGISWAPEDGGNYSVEIFVWRSIDDPGPALTKSMTVHVEP